jgi:hypothetical protein
MGQSAIRGVATPVLFFECKSEGNEVAISTNIISLNGGVFDLTVCITPDANVEYKPTLVPTVKKEGCASGFRI